LPALKARADALGLRFAPVNSNTFQDQVGQPHSYKYGSLTHTDAAAGKDEAAADEGAPAPKGQALPAAVVRLVKKVENKYGQAGDRQAIESRAGQLMRDRKEKQPQGLANAGSFFKNPAGMPPAGKLIQDADLKGVSVGGAQVSEVHANFLVNTGSATAQDFFDLMRLVQEKVFERFGVRLEPEVHIL
jgi:UDP-N-acetylenolpyruvoylglucosamine reductase